MAEHTQIGGSLNLIPNKGDQSPSYMINGESITANNFENLIVVKQDNVSDTLGGEIDPDKEYFIDGRVDLTGTGITINVPDGGFRFTGFDVTTSRLICTDDNYTLFQTDPNVSGSVYGRDCLISVSGNNSQVYDLLDPNGVSVVEMIRVNYANCTSLGEINGYSQGLENVVGRFGGTPQLTLSGNWSGGYFIDTSLTRNLLDGVYSLFSAGSGFVMNSRFRSNQNLDLPDNVSFFDFSSSNFANPSTIQINEAIVTRNGVFDANDTNITPNITASDIACNWKNNTGIPNTFEGGSIGVATTATTTIGTQGQFVTLLAGSWTTRDLQHFDNPTSGQLRHLGNSPREYKVIADFTIQSEQDSQLALRVTKFDSETSTNEEILTQIRQVNSLRGNRDVAFFNININVELDQNDYVFLEITNNTLATDAIAEIDSYYIVEER